MKKLLYIFAFISLNSFSQSKYLTKSGTISFEASVPSFEEVAAKTNTATAILNTDNGEFAALILVKGFRFKNALMEEHFNENYAESDKYPKATFKGILKSFSKDQLQTSTTFKIDGKLTFHGKSKQLQDIPLTVETNNNTITITGNFIAYPADFDIKIPKIVRNKIAETVEVSFNFELHKK
ncbi:YceI family protein [Snuella sedimenti]|uniref:YceI family protein n=1 Tax=Snuella sedimenti TaxID=2798802 RepID=A0A8J7J076_9FLAO|nr:YceI family protein [Snuella sedimenti]MBJ6367087.1 YceI family protein [Snuella sedimenti]